MFKERKIPTKNYIYLGIILFLSIMLMIYFYMWYLQYEETKLNTMILDRYLTVINYNELDEYLIENKNAYVYTSILEDEKIRNFEIKFKNTIVSNTLGNKLLYLNITDNLKDKEVIKEYSINNKSISNVPCILVFKEGKLFDIYQIDINDYDEENIVNYLDSVDFLE